MTIQEIIDRARALTYTSAAQYNDTQAIEDLNIVYNTIINTIINNVDEDFFYSFYNTKTVNWQNEYTIDSRISKIKKLTVDGQEYTQVDWQQNSTRTFYVKGNSIFLNITPTKDNLDIVLEAVDRPVKLTTTSLETDIAIPTELHHYIANWMKQYVYQKRGKINEKNDAIREFKQIDLPEIVSFLTDRWENPTIEQMPDLSYYE